MVKSKSQHALLVGLLLSLAAAAMADYFILLEDGTRLTHGDLKAQAKGKCCFTVNFPFALTYSSSNKIRFFQAEGCADASELNSSTFPAMIKSIDLCATGCDPNKGCGLNAMDVKGVSTKGGRWPLNQGQECAAKDGATYMDKTCKAVGKDNKFQYRLQCTQDCTNAWTCQEPSFDKSKCSAASSGAPVVTFVGIGQKCGYTQDNKQYACGGNHVSCSNGVCASTLPSSGSPPSSGGAPVVTFVGIGQKCGYTQDNKQYACGGNHVSCSNGVCTSTLPSSGSPPSSGGAPVVTFVGIGQKCGYTQDNKQYACGGNHVSCSNGVCASTLPGR